MELDSDRELAQSRKIFSKTGLSSALSYLHSADFGSKFEFIGKTLIRVSVVSSLTQLLAYTLLFPSFFSIEASNTELILLALFPVLHLFSLFNDLVAALGLSREDSRLIKRSFISSLALFFLFLGLFLLRLLGNTLSRPEKKSDIRHPISEENDSVYPLVNYALVFFLFFTHQGLRLSYTFKSYRRHEQLLSKSNLENN